MSNLKLDLKKFKGRVNNVPYRITYEIKETVVALHLRAILFKQEIFVDTVVGLYDDNVKDGVKMALKRASEKWNIDLTKANLKVA